MLAARALPCTATAGSCHPALSTGRGTRGACPGRGVPPRPRSCCWLLCFRVHSSRAAVVPGCSGRDVDVFNRAAAARATTAATAWAKSLRRICRRRGPGLTARRGSASLSSVTSPRWVPRAVPSRFGCGASAGFLLGVSLSRASGAVVRPFAQRFLNGEFLEPTRLMLSPLRADAHGDGGGAQPIREGLQGAVAELKPRMLAQAASMFDMCDFQKPFSLGRACFLQLSGCGTSFSVCRLHEGEVVKRSHPGNDVTLSLVPWSGRSPPGWTRARSCTQTRSRRRRRCPPRRRAFTPHPPAMRLLAA